MIKAEIVADSLSPQGDRLISVLATFPRIILAEVNTHRMLSKNTSSSRAIPFNKMVEAIKTNPFIPIAWQKEHKGMQGTEYFDFSANDETKNELVGGWLSGRDAAVLMATYLNSKKVTKQLCNRLLEPYMWTTMLITGNLKGGWDNFFELRCPRYGGDGLKSWKEYTSDDVVDDAVYDAPYKLSHNKGQAEIHMMALAEEIYDAINENIPRHLESGEWHIPFSDNFDMGHFADTINGIDYTKMIKVSTAMSARTSYTVVGEEKTLDYDKLASLHDRLISQNPPHSSPMEHCALVMSDKQYGNYFKGYNPITNDTDFGWCRNFRGFIPYRHIIEVNKH